LKNRHKVLQVEDVVYPLKLDNKKPRALSDLPTTPGGGVPKQASEAVLLLRSAKMERQTRQESKESGEKEKKHHTHSTAPSPDVGASDREVKSRRAKTMSSSNLPSVDRVILSLFLSLSFSFSFSLSLSLFSLSLSLLIYLLVFRIRSAGRFHWMK